MEIAFNLNLVLLSSRQSITTPSQEGHASNSALELGQSSKLYGGVLSFSRVCVNYHVDFGRWTFPDCPRLDTWPNVVKTGKKRGRLGTLQYVFYVVNVFFGSVLAGSLFTELEKVRKGLGFSGLSSTRGCTNCPPGTMVFSQGIEKLFLGEIH